MAEQDEAEEVLRAIVERLEDGPDRAALIAEVLRIHRGTDGSQTLDGQYLVLAALIVQVGMIVMETCKLVAGFRERRREAKLMTILSRIVETTGEKDAASDPTVRRIAQAAIDVTSDDHTKT
jgi:hypothetical protein